MSLKRQWKRHHRREAPELSITAFMNLMVILVPFLLITAVFSRLAILEMRLPTPSDTPPEQQQEDTKQLRLIVRADGLTLQKLDGKKPAELPSVANDNPAKRYDYESLRDELKKIKAKYPKKKNISLLFEQDIPYDVMVQIMDTVRVIKVIRDGEVKKGELFPDISIGDAPLSTTPQTSADNTAETAP